MIGRKKRAALVLGSPPASRRIAQVLQSHGFQVHLESDLPQGCPSPRTISVARTSDLLQEALSSFTQLAAAGGATEFWLHPGTSLWAERAELPTVGTQLGVHVVSPSARVLTLFGNKLGLLSEATNQGIPTLALSLDPLTSLREVERWIASGNHKLPLLLKSVWNRGGSGRCLIYQSEDLEKKVPLWLEQLRYTFGEAAVFPERYLEGGRFITLPFTRFKDGRIHFFPIVDASLQCRHRKVVEFCPAPMMDEALIDLTRSLASVFTERCGYVGLGSLDFLVDGSRAHLVGGLARLNSAYPLWEKVTETRAVDWQLAAMDLLASPEPPSLNKTSQACRRAGIAIRLYAEDSLLQLPQPGRIRELSDQRNWSFPEAEAEGELDLGLRPGEEISPCGDGFLGELYVLARDFKQSITLAAGILGEVWIAGSLQTNSRFLVELLQHSWVREGFFHAGFVDEEFLPSISPPREIVLAFSRVCADHPQLRASAPAVRRFIVGDRWVKSDSYALQWTGVPDYWSDDQGFPGVSGKIRLSDGSDARVCATPLGPEKWQVRIGPWAMVVRSRAQDPTQPRESVLKILAMVSGKVHSIHFREGAVVSSHESLLIVESLGTLVPHAVSQPVRVVRWKVAAEQKVIIGQELAEFERVAVT